MPVMPILGDPAPFSAHMQCTYVLRDNTNITENQRVGPLQGRAHQLVVRYQTASPETDI